MACETLCIAMGEGRTIDDFRPEDFGQLRAAASKRLGVLPLSKFVQLVKTEFHFTFASEFNERPVRYGAQFDKPAVPPPPESEFDERGGDDDTPLTGGPS